MSSDRTYRVDLAPSAQRDLKQIKDEQDLLRIDRRIRGLEDDPRTGSNIKKLSGEESLYRCRVGDYRIIYVVDDSALIVRVARVRHRKDVYRH